MTQLVTITVTMAVTSKTQGDTDATLTRVSDLMADAAKYVDGTEVLSVVLDYVGTEHAGETVNT